MVDVSTGVITIPSFDNDGFFNWFMTDFSLIKEFRDEK